MPLSGSLPAPSVMEAEAGHNADTLFQMLSGHWTAQTVRTLAELRVVDHVVAGADSADAIAKHEGSDPDTTRRLMRAGAALGLLTVLGAGASPRLHWAVCCARTSPAPRATPRWCRTRTECGRHGRRCRQRSAGRTQVEAAVGTDMFGYFATHPEEGRLFAKAMSNMTGLVVEDTLTLLDLPQVDRWCAASRRGRGVG